MIEEAFRTWTEINLDQMQKNLRVIRHHLGADGLLMGVVKADAYGHGVRVCSRYAEPYVDWLATATVEEAIAIRDCGVHKPILIFGSVADEKLEEAAEKSLTLCLFSVEYAEHVQAVLKRRGLCVDGHLKIDTGMNRLGLRARVHDTAGAVSQAKKIYALPNLRVTGIYTHFACADTQDPSDAAFTAGQYTAFCQVCETLQSEGYSTGVRHCLSSGGFLCHPEYRLDMIRTGMLPLGQSISEESAAALGIAPALTWYARIVDIREIPAGESISYGRIYTTKAPERIAVISAGYADGYSRALSNCSEVIIGGRRAAVRGKICMDFMMADVTDIPGVCVGDPVVLLGKSEGQWISTDFLAARIPYGVNGAITADIGIRVPRVYLRQGKVVEITRHIY